MEFDWFSVSSVCVEIVRSIGRALNLLDNGIDDGLNVAGVLMDLCFGTGLKG